MNKINRLKKYTFSVNLLKLLTIKLKNGCRFQHPLETAAQFVVIEVGGLHTRTKQDLQRFVFKELRRQRHGPIGKSQAIENHSGF